MLQSGFGIALLFILLLVCIILFVAENRRSHTKLSINEHKIISDKIPFEFHNKKIAFLSDLHNNEFGMGNEKLLQLLDQANPDYVFVGGDMLVSKYGDAYDTALDLLTKLAQKYPVYCGNGNHEARLLWKAEENPASGRIYHDYIESIKKSGVRHLCNETCKIEFGNTFIYLSEVDLSQYYYKKFKTRYLELSHMEQLVGKCKQDSFHILLAHNPAYFDTYGEWGADITLSGHIHGGIMRLPLLGGVIDPAYHLFPKYDAGLFEKETKKMIVSVGLGTHSIKIRLWNPPIIDIITLKNSEKEGKHE